MILCDINSVALFLNNQLNFENNSTAFWLPNYVTVIKKNMLTWVKKRSLR